MVFRSRLVAGVAGLAGLAVFVTGTAIAQAGPEADTGSERTQAGYTAPRLAIGQPDLQGAWSNASLTGLERRGGPDKLILSDEEALASAEGNPLVVRQRTDDGQDETTEFDGSDLQRGRGYNAFWLSPGTMYGNVKGTFRTSWIVEPANGRIPFSEAGQEMIREVRMNARRGSGYDHPEERSLGERCILSFAGNGGPVMLNSQFYNDNYRIVQSPTHVMIEVEMVHDARIIELFDSAEAARAASGPDAIRPYLGTSVGWWEGDTLVAETTNFHPGQLATGRVSVTENGKVTERFTRYSDDQILYEFEVDDPALYSQVWKGEISLNKLTGDGDVYEYACHEGNYGIEGILAGARQNDRQGIDNGVSERDEG